MIEIDGSHGEGGGQILRTALSLSCLEGKPFRIRNLRKGRRKPGLMPQHLMAVRAAQHLSRAEVSGAAIGSTELAFSPGRVAGGEFTFDIGTAGSTSLLLQALLPALISCGRKSIVTLVGGTHVPGSPTFDYLAQVFAASLRRLDLEVRLHLKSCGFYPKGGGRVTAEISPAAAITPLHLMERGRWVRFSGCSAVGNLPLSIAERQKHAFIETVTAEAGDAAGFDTIDVRTVPTPGAGTFLFCRAESEHAIAGFSSLGERGKRAETVGEEAARDFLAYHGSEAALDPHLADQIVLYLALAAGKSAFTTTCITSHLLTNLWVIGLFHDFSWRLEGEVGEKGAVFINGRPLPAAHHPEPPEEKA